MSSDVNKTFGIDLGTTYSAISYVDEYGKPVVVSNADNSLVTPSVAYFESPQNVIVGQAAKDYGRIDPKNYVELIKRNMGDPLYRRALHGKEFRPEDISAVILKKLKEDAERSLNATVRDVVITVPAYFNEAQRTATEQAGIIAGLHVRSIIPEPTAAAIAYAATDAGDQSLLVYDLGGGTFDVSVMTISSQQVRVVCIQGDHDLGGRNWDELVVAYLAHEWKAQSGSHDDPLDSPETLQDLFKSAEEAKRLLSRLNKTPIKIGHAGHSARVELTREKFDELTSALLERTISLTRDAVTEARTLGVSRIDRILLVGGSSYMPQVQNRLKAEFSEVAQQLFEPEQAVAKGAALYASSKQIQDAYQEALRQVVGRTDVALNGLPADTRNKVEKAVQGRLPGRSKQALASGLNLEIVNVCSKSFGLVVEDENSQTRVVYLIKRNSPVPAEQADTFGTLVANQPDVAIKIIEAEEIDLKNLPSLPDDHRCRQIKVVTLNLPPGLPIRHPIEVKYSLSEDGGRLRVNARDPQSGRSIDDTVDTFDAISPQDLRDKQKDLALIEIQ